MVLCVREVDLGCDGTVLLLVLAGVFFGPLWGGFVEYRFGWGAMVGTLGVLAALTAMPMLWLGEDEERPLFGREGMA